MPANLTPEYLKADQEYKTAKTPEEKIVCLKHMLSVMPKHKGTDRLQGDLKRKIAELKEAVESRIKKKGPSYRVRPEGAGQIVLIGPPNSGKSALLAALTRAEPEVADYPCTTREPMPGMVEFQGVQIQLVDLPPVWREHCESFVFDNIRGSDGALLVVDLAAQDPVADVQDCIALLAEKHIDLVPARITGGVQQREDGKVEYLLIHNKVDTDPRGELQGLVQEMLNSHAPIRAVSAAERTGLDALAADLFRMLHVIRIYAKQPGRPPDLETPVTAPVGTTAVGFAAMIHKDLAENFRWARVWGSARFDGQIVQRDHVLQDRDVVELTMQ